MERFKGICARCKHRAQCNRPCYFVERLLVKDQTSILEKQTGDNTLMYFGHPKEKRFSEIFPSTMKDILNMADTRAAEDDRAAELPFDPTINLSDIFYKHRFSRNVNRHSDIRI